MQEISKKELTVWEMALYYRRWEELKRHTQLLREVAEQVASDGGKTVVTSAALSAITSVEHIMDILEQKEYSLNG